MQVRPLTRRTLGPSDLSQLAQWVLTLLLTACPPSRQPTEVRSTAYPTAEQRVATLCDFALCPTRPSDARFHVYPIDEGTVVHAVAKIAVDDVPRWSMGCTRVILEARPSWVTEVMGANGWALKTAPDTWMCGGEKRVLHVKEGVVIRALLRPPE